MKIGKLANAAGLRVQTIRYYELEGLLRPQGRTEGGYRVFLPEALERLEFIKKAKRLGLTLAEIRDILTVRAREEPTCAHVRGLLESKLAEVDQALHELQEFREQLVGLLRQSETLEDCRPSGGRICGIIEGAPLVEGPAVLQRLKDRRRGA